MRRSFRIADQSYCYGDVCRRQIAKKNKLGMRARKTGSLLQTWHKLSSVWDDALPVALTQFDVRAYDNPKQSSRHGARFKAVADGTSQLLLKARGRSRRVMLIAPSVKPARQER